MRRSKPRLAVCAVALLAAALAPPAAHAGDQLTIEPTPAGDGLRHMAHAFVAYDGQEFTDFLRTFEFPELTNAFIDEVEVDLYNPFKGDVLLEESVALTAQIEYSLSMVFNPYAEDVPNPARSSRALSLGLDGTTELGDANSFSTTLPALAGSTHPSFRDFTLSFGEGLGVPVGGSELAANGNKISSFVSDPGTTDAPLTAVYFLGGRTMGRSDGMGCSGTIRDRGLFFRPLADFKGQERLNWDDSTGANSAVFNDFFLNGSFGLINSCSNSIRYDPPTLRSFAGPGSGFVDSVPNAVTYVGPFGWFSIVAAGDVPDVEGYRLLDFVTDAGVPFTSETTAASIFPDDFTSFEPMSNVTALVIDPTLTSTPEPAAEEVTTDEPATDSEPEAEVVAEPETSSDPETETASTPDSGTGSPSDSGGDGRIAAIVLIVVGLTLVALGIWWLWRFGGSGGSARRDPGGTRVRTRREHGSTPPIGLIPPHERETPTCDWALYFNDGGNRVVLREANFQSIECCVYDISVATTIIAHEQVAKARQDDDGERLRIFDLDFPWRWVGLDAHTSTRSGPLGRLDWMHGLGDPTDQSAQIPDEPYWQQGQGEEPPEGAIKLLHVEFTEVRLKLTPECPEYESLYTYNADTKLNVMSTVECTNEAHDPECPVELNAFGGALGAIVGDVKTVSAFDLTGTDPDELERAGRRLADGFDPDDPDSLAMPGARPLWDGHDHDTRDRLTYEAEHKDRSSDVNESDTFVAYILTIVDLNAGQIVPVAVYPATERVSTHIETHFDHSLIITGEMTSKNCESNGCSGHGRCACNPKFKLTVARSGSWIDVDGDQYPILRIPTSADRNSPPGRQTNPWELQK